MSVDLNIHRARIGLHYHRHRLFRVKGLGKFNNFELLTFLATLLYRAGDVEKNPGPTINTCNDRNQSFSFPPLQGNLSLVHYNVQSILYKTDILEPELANFDIISLTETWLNDSVLDDDIMFDQFQVPFRRDRVGDSHGGILVYVKNEIPCKRRVDLELLNIECVWIEINIKNRKILIGTFYRPPNASPIIRTDIENLIGLAVDTRITDVIVTVDLDQNMLNQQQNN